MRGWVMYFRRGPDGTLFWSEHQRDDGVTLAWVRVDGWAEFNVWQENTLTGGLHGNG